MGNQQDSWKQAGNCSQTAIVERVKDWKEYLIPPEDATLKARLPAVWTAAFLFAIWVVLSETSFQTGTIWFIATAGRKPLSVCMLPIISRIHRRLCPAPCENSCTLNLDVYTQPVTIKQIEVSIIDHA